MAFGGDVDTLALTFDKLQYIFRGYDPYIQSFTEMHTLHKQGKLPERDYYHGIIDSVLRYSALEFLGLKALFEIKKSLNKMITPPSTGGIPQGLKSGNVMDASVSGPQNSVSTFITAKSLPGRDEMLQKILGNEKTCFSCGKKMSSVAKYCPICGTKV